MPMLRPPMKKASAWIGRWLELLPNSPGKASMPPGCGHQK
jgi:hypothetical protein